MVDHCQAMELKFKSRVPQDMLINRPVATIVLHTELSTIIYIVIQGDIHIPLLWPWSTMCFIFESVDL